MAGKILIVDDDPLILETISFFVTAFGHECKTASGGLEALELLKHEEFSIVISDIVMPGMNGMELLKKIKNNYPKTGVIIVTGYAEDYSYSEVIRSGAIDFIAKPFQKDELEAKLNRVIREQELIEKLELLSNCDALTGLYNRRFFDKKFLEEVFRAARQEYQLVLAMLDVDKFKTYNDTYGHQSGDLLLESISRVLKICTRENADFLFRYGGDEFAIILTQTPIEQAVHVAQRVIDTYKEQKIEIGETGLSIGLVECDGQGSIPTRERVSTLIDQADKALYESKNNGRNRVCVWQQNGFKMS